MDTLVTGGSGLLGQNLKQYYPEAFYPTHQELDVTQDIQTSVFCQNKDLSQLKLVIHCAAIKNTQCTNDPQRALKTNIIGTANVALFCIEKHLKMVYISTDYVFKGDRGNYKVTDEVMPVNYYGETKLAGEYITKGVPSHLIIRLSFFPDQFPYEHAFFNQYTTRVPVSKAAERIQALIQSGACGLKHIAGKKQTSYEYALETCTEWQKIISKSLDFDGYIRPCDTSLLEK